MHFAVAEIGVGFVLFFGEVVGAVITVAHIAQPDIARLRLQFAIAIGRAVTEIDYGTPASRSEKTVALTIDGVEVRVPEGTSIMRAAMEVGTARTRDANRGTGQSPRPS